jgi:hypothetical protein
MRHSWLDILVVLASAVFILAAWLLVAYVAGAILGAL